MKLKWGVFGIVFAVVGFSSPGFCQDISYDSLWNRVVDLELRELPQSAHALVDSIYHLAKEENNSNHRIKALIYQSKFLLALEEDAQLKIIKRFREEIASSRGVHVNMLQSMLAEVYWQYLDRKSVV